jgi:hypothetical protein
VLSGGWEAATAAVLALPTKYRQRLRTSKRDPSGSSRRSGGEKKSSASSNGKSVWRLIGALCAEKHEEWPMPEGATSRWRSSIAGRRHTKKRLAKKLPLNLNSYR